MDNLQELKKRKNKLEKELNKITLNYTDNGRNYSDNIRANEIIRKIDDLNTQINTYYSKIKERNEELKHKGESLAIIARYEAQERLLHMSKEEQAYAAMTGEKERFNHLWHKSNIVDEQIQKEIASELNKMFRR